MLRNQVGISNDLASLLYCRSSAEIITLSAARQLVRWAGDDCADMTCYNPGFPKLPVIHRYDCAGTKLNPLTGRVIRKVPVPHCK
jgi:hypothetical protein